MILTIFLNLSPPLCLRSIVQHDLVPVDVEFIVRARHILVCLYAHARALVRVVWHIFSSGRTGRRGFSLFCHVRGWSEGLDRGCKEVLGFGDFLMLRKFFDRRAWGPWRREKADKLRAFILLHTTIYLFTTVLLFLFSREEKISNGLSFQITQVDGSVPRRRL